MFNWLLVGIGDIAIRRVIPAIQAEPSSLLYGVVTRDPAKGERYAGKVWTSLEQALGDPAIDLVYISTPVALHAPQTICALRAGKHVLCEKPMALRYEDASAMVQAAREAQRTLGVAYYRRKYPKIERARELIAAGAIGRPVMAWATLHDWFNSEDGRRAWLLEPALAGAGPLFDVACHRIDVFNFLFGKPARVAAQTSNLVHQRPVEDNATVLIEYETGVRGIVDVRWHSRLASDELRVIGTEGELDLTPLNSPELHTPAGTEMLPPHANLHYPIVADFVESVAADRAPVSTGESALWTDWVLNQALRSAAAQRAV